MPVFKYLNTCCVQGQDHLAGHYLLALLSRSRPSFCSALRTKTTADHFLDSLPAVLVWVHPTGAEKRENQAVSSPSCPQILSPQFYLGPVASSVPPRSPATAGGSPKPFQIQPDGLAKEEVIPLLPIPTPSSPVVAFSCCSSPGGLALPCLL